MLETFKRVDYEEHYSEEGEFLWVRVEINIDELLVKSLTINYDYPEPQIVKVKYEKLKFFCYYYDFLDHDDKDCIEKNEDREEGIAMDEVQRLREYRPELKVELNSPKLSHEIFQGRNQPATKEPGKSVARNIRKEFKSEKMTGDSSSTSPMEGTSPKIHTENNHSKLRGVVIKEYMLKGGVTQALLSQGVLGEKTKPCRFEATELPTTEPHQQPLSAKKWVPRDGNHMKGDGFSQSVNL